MAEQLIISVSGMRGIIGENLSAPTAAEYGCAFGTFLKNKHSGKKEKLTVCVARDSRPSGQMLGSAVAAGLCAPRDRASLGDANAAPGAGRQTARFL